MRTTTELPDDPALPGLVAIRATGLACAIPALGLDHHPVELVLHRYHPGLRATIEARVDNRHLAIKVFALDPEPEVAMCEALAAAGLGGSNSEVRVPPLLACDRDLRVLVTGWLEGATGKRLIKRGQGARAGQLAARWLRRASSVPIKRGPVIGAARRLEQARIWVAELGAGVPPLGTVATTLAEILAQTQPGDGAPQLVHGSLYADHV